MKQKIILGTYTRRKSEGIYTIELNTAEKKLDNLALLVKENSPTYLAKSKKENLYTVTSIDGKGGLGAYTSDQTFINAVTEEGAPLCYVAVDEARQLVYGANYHKGEVNVYHINPDGSIQAADAIFHQEPTGPHKNQDHAHVHYTDLTPDQRLAVCDLGTDRVYTYDVDANGHLTLANIYVAEPGTGPRHLTFHPDGKTAYMFGELDNTITVLAYDDTSGSFTKQQKLSTLPVDFTGENGGAAIRISADGHFVYASNRGHNSIVVFAVDPTNQQLSLIQHIATEGDFPRDFSLDNTNEFLVCANQNTDNLSLYQRNQESGLLTLLEKDIYAPETVCVYFSN